MKAHIKKIHDRVKDKLCPHCSYATYSGYNLKLHISKMHLGGKLVKQPCPFCDVSTTNVDYHIEIYHAGKTATKPLTLQWLSLKSFRDLVKDSYVRHRESQTVCLLINMQKGANRYISDQQMWDQDCFSWTPSGPALPQNGKTVVRNGSNITSLLHFHYK